jgi:hypothetical protein
MATGTSTCSCPLIRVEGPGYRGTLNKVSITPMSALLDPSFLHADKYQHVLLYRWYTITWSLWYAKGCLTRSCSLLTILDFLHTDGC